MGELSADELKTHNVSACSSRIKENLAYGGSIIGVRVGTEGATGALVPVMLKPWGQKYLFPFSPPQ